MSDKKQTREDLDEQIDKQLLKILKKGAKVVTKDGDIVTVTASHQYFEVIRKRLSDLGLTGERDKDSNAARLADKYNSDPGGMETHNNPEFIAEPSEEPETAVG